MFTVGVEVHDGVGTVSMTGEVDYGTADRLRGVALVALANGAASLVIDCEHVPFIDSAGLRVLAEAHAAADVHAGTITIRHPSAQMTRLLEMTGLSDVLTVEPVGEPVAGADAPRHRPALRRPLDSPGQPLL
jgi:anti-sigma B factor antagonist